VSHCYEPLQNVVTVIGTWRWIMSTGSRAACRWPLFVWLSIVGAAQNDSSLVCSWIVTVCADIQCELETYVSKCQQLDADKLQLVMFLLSLKIFLAKILGSMNNLDRQDSKETWAVITFCPLCM